MDVGTRNRFSKSFASPVWLKYDAHGSADTAQTYFTVATGFTAAGSGPPQARVDLTADGGSATFG